MPLIGTLWTKEQIHSLVGDYTDAWVGYATDARWREKAASGGCVTAFLAYLLDNALIDGAIVCRTTIMEGKVRASFNLVYSSRELEGSQGSFYAATRFAVDVPKLIEVAKGRIAVVGLPCDLRFLTHLLANRRPENCEVVLKISLFCGHVSQIEAVDVLTDRLSKKARSELSGFVFREGLWRGNLKASFADGTVIKKPAFYFNVYQNLYFFCASKCLSCHDHFGYCADISFGDLWLMKMKREPIKHSSIITKSRMGLEMLMKAGPALTLHETPIETILNGQRRSALTHHNVTARKRVGKYFGVEINDSLHCKARLIDLMVAAVVLFNYRVSRSLRSIRVIMSVPRPLMKFYLYIFKALETLR